MEAKAYNSNAEFVSGAFRALSVRLHRQVLRWRATHHAKAVEGELMGLYVSDREVDTLLDNLFREDDESAGDDQTPGDDDTSLAQLIDDIDDHHVACTQLALRHGTPLPFITLIERFQLDAVEAGAILLGLAVELDRRYERLYGYLNDDIARRQPSIDMVLGMYCDNFDDRMSYRRAFNVDSTLLKMQLIHLTPDTTSLPLLGRTFKLDERMTAFLTGEPTLDTSLRRVQVRHDPSLMDHIRKAIGFEAIDNLSGQLYEQGDENVIVRIACPDNLIGIATAQSVSRVPCLVLDGERLAQDTAPGAMIARALRDAIIDGAPIVLQASEALTQGGTACRDALVSLLEAEHLAPRFLISSSVHHLPTVQTPHPMLTLELPALDTLARERIWHMQGGDTWHAETRAEVADRFRLSAQQIVEAANMLRAQQGQCEPDREAWFAACQMVSSHGLADLARRIKSPHGWDDLIVSQAAKQRLMSLERWMRYRGTVYRDWGYARRVNQPEGFVVLFSGAPGTGKTMAAGIIARNLGLDMYRIDLASVVSKYVGETEKNLSRIFDVAQEANAILFFDEADALFGKRSETKDAHDRYANIEVSYLLQRIEVYEGLAILATNFRQNLDEAFSRRLHMAVDFTLPSVVERRHIWDALLPSEVPQADDIDRGFLARKFSLSGGSIKNCVITAALEAASHHEPIGMAHLIRAIAQELEKSKQPIVPDEFDRYYPLTQPS